MTPTIIQVPVDLIYPHPSNPRRDLGDLTVSDVEHSRLQPDEEGEQ